MMSKHQWILSDADLQVLILALQTDIHSIEQDASWTAQEKQALIATRNELGMRLKAIRDTFRKDVDEDHMWSERDQAVVSVRPKLGDEEYTVVPWGPDRWVIVEKANPHRPVNEHVYTHKTHAHRKKRELNRAAREMNAIMEANGGALIL